MPTNDWWSSLAWLPFSDRQYPHPLAVQAEPGGLRVYYPGPQITANKDAIFGFMPGPSGDDLVLGHSEQPEFSAADVDAFSDWFVTARFQAPKHVLRTSYGHGSPFVFATFEGGSPKLSFAQTPKVWSGGPSSPVLGVSIGNHHYGLFAPAGATWSGWDTKVLTCRTTKPYFSLAVLPDATNETLELFRGHAYAHVVDTRVAWAYDQKASTVKTAFTFKTKAWEGDQRATLFALYPHQWRHTNHRLLNLEFASVRGRMRLAEGTAFETTVRYPGVLPCLPNVGGADKARMTSYLKSEVQIDESPPKDTYWEGKRLGRMATLVPIAEQYGEDDLAHALLDRLRSRLETWLKEPQPDSAGHWQAGFYYDMLWGTLIGYPASFGSDNELNDHHFHYGYFIRAAAEVARHDPQWASDKQWGSMIKLLIRDIADWDRTDQQFPLLRNFDPYAGHSWASGHAKFADGNNNESSSEAMNAWYGLILWGEATGDPIIRDLGVYLYTTEMTAIQEYWFDVFDENHPADFTPSVVTMVWGGKGANGTWFSNNPEMVHGINWLPIHGGSLYLGHNAAYAEKNYAALVAENNGARWDEWADLVCMYRALSDADDAARQFEVVDKTQKYEAGNSPANAYHWIGSLRRLGQVNATITADTTLYAVFTQGKIRTYCAFNSSRKPLTVTFSDGHRLQLNRPGFIVERK